MNVKKIFDLIFEPVDEQEEAEEVIVDKPLKRHEFKEEVKPKKVENKVSTNVDEKREEIKKKDVLDRTFSKYDISASNKKTINMTIAPKRQEPKPVKYVKQPPMSPIFGVLASEKAQNAQVPKYIPTNKPSAKSPLGTVLSPIYGVMNATKDEEKEIIEKTQDKEVKIVSQSNIAPLSDNFDDISYIKDEPKESTFKSEEIINAQMTVKKPLSEVLSRPQDEEETYISSEDITLFDDLEK